MKSKSVKEVYKICKGKKAQESITVTELRYIQIEDLRSDNELKYAISENNNVICDKNDILIAWDGANAGTIGYKLEGIIGSTLAKLTPKINNINSEYVGRFLQSKFRYLRDNCTGATIPHISRPILEALKIPLPPLPIQQKIAAILDEADKVRQLNQQLIDKYDALTQSLFLDMFGDPGINPKKWIIQKLSEIILNGPTNGLYRPSKDYGTGVPIIRIDAFYNGIVQIKGLKRVRISENELVRYSIEEGDFVVNRVNSPSHLGKCGLVPNLSEKIVYESNMMRISIDKEKVNNRFLLMVLSSQYVKNQILNASKDAVNQSSINQKDVNSFVIPVPPITLQNQFAKLVQAIEQQKNQAQASLQKSEELFNSLLQRAFKGELV